MSKRHLVFALFLFGCFGCSESNQVTLEFRVAEDEQAPGLMEMVLDLTGERFYLHDEVLVDESDGLSGLYEFPGLMLIISTYSTRRYGDWLKNHAPDTLWPMIGHLKTTGYLPTIPPEARDSYERRVKPVIDALRAAGQVEV